MSTEFPERSIGRAPLADLSGALSGIWAASPFDSATRLHRLQAGPAFSGLHIEAWSFREALNEPSQLSLVCVGENVRLNLDAMLLQPVVLQTVLADGSMAERAGIVMKAERDDGDGGLVRWLLDVRPWLSMLAHTRRSQVFQERGLREIVDAIFGRYGALAAWRWADDVDAHLMQSPYAGAEGLRSYTAQYRETDLHFVRRLLAEEGLNFRFERDTSAPAGHRLVIFAQSGASPEDVTSASGRGIAFHRAGQQEERDAVQHFGGVRSFAPARTVRLAWDYKAKRAIAVEVPARGVIGGANAPQLEDYRPERPYAFADVTKAARAAELAAQASGARHKRWIGQSTVRSLAAGASFTLRGSPLDALQELGADPENRSFVVTSVVHAGINNLPKTGASSTQASDLLQDWVPEELYERVRATGYANRFEASRIRIPWRPAPVAKPKVDGMLSATVVGPEGQTSASGADEIHMDRLGRIRIRHHFQRDQGPATSESSTWVRVLQRWAGSGMGLQFIPRIGQEVLVDFFDGDIDRPIVVAALYNGRGEGGVAATPGGRDGAVAQGAFAGSGDHRPGGQGNLTAGNAPPWHGAAPAAVEAGGQANAAALSGIKTKEFGGAGYNQLVFDDTDAQARAQLATTQHATHLSIGHLIHQADNHRGSFRGLGFELRTDAYGVVRGRRGVLLSSYGTQPGEPAMDNAASIALANHFRSLAGAFDKAAGTHETVRLATVQGGAKAGQSAVSEKEAPLAALHTALKTMVSEASLEQAQGDAASRSTATSEGKVPGTADPVVAIAAKAGLIAVAGQDLQMSAGETLSVGAGQDIDWATGGAVRLHTGQAIGALAGVVKPGDQAAGTGITLIPGKDDIDLQAQADRMQIAAKGMVNIASKSAHIDWAAAKRIVLQTEGGASVTLEGGMSRWSARGRSRCGRGRRVL